MIIQTRKPTFAHACLLLAAFVAGYMVIINFDRIYPNPLVATMEQGGKEFLEPLDSSRETWHSLDIQPAQHPKHYVQEEEAEQQQRQQPADTPGASKPEPSEVLGVYFARTAEGWDPLNCDRKRKLRRVSVPTGTGNFTFYVYDSTLDDASVTSLALKGKFFELKEIDRFLWLSRDLPLIDVGANVGVVSLQAARQGRRVVAVEPIPENALRLCRAALDFGHAHLVRVVGNAVSSSEGNVTLAMDLKGFSTHFEVQRKEGWGHGAVTAYSVFLDRLLEVVDFKRAALKVDVESHEGHVMAGAEKLFQAVDIRMVWMEWAHVKGRKDDLQYGPVAILDFMHRHGLKPYNLMTGSPLDTANYMNWPFTVLWMKNGEGDANIRRPV